MFQKLSYPLTGLLSQEKYYTSLLCLLQDGEILTNSIHAQIPEDLIYEQMNTRNFLLQSIFDIVYSTLIMAN